jgi:HPt (histidine-containing phosphotransfer) domain-containing protein
MMTATPEIGPAGSHESTGTLATSSESGQQDPQNGPPIDLQQLLENCLGMPMFAVSLLDEFARTAASRIEAFEEKFKEANLPAIAELAHALKGVAGIIGARSLREYTIEIESACQNQDLPMTAQLVHTIRVGILRIQHDIPDISKHLLAGNDRKR